jgi:hypothetical protein
VVSGVLAPPVPELRACCRPRTCRRSVAAKETAVAGSEFSRQHPPKPVLFVSHCKSGGAVGQRCSPPPAQVPASGTTAPGSCLESWPAQYQPAHAQSTARTVRDRTSGGRKRGSSRRWPGRGAPRRRCCRPARGSWRPRTSPAWVPWRISYSPLIHQMICHTKPLKNQLERVRRQSLSLRQHALSGHSFSVPDQRSETRRMRAFSAIHPNHSDWLTRPFQAVFRVSQRLFSDATEPRSFWYGCWKHAISMS